MARNRHLINRRWPIWLWSCRYGVSHQPDYLANHVSGSGPAYPLPCRDIRPTKKPISLALSRPACAAIITARLSAAGHQPNMDVRDSQTLLGHDIRRGRTDRSSLSPLCGHSAAPTLTAPILSVCINPSRRLLRLFIISSVSEYGIMFRYMIGKPIANRPS